MRVVTALTGVSAILIAGCAAFFSITGLGLLFSGATMAVIIMATSLEIGKLVAATYLHNYWKHTNGAIKTYMIIGIVTLITITSAGIFGFLSDAYTQTQISVNQAESVTQLYEDQQTRVLADVPRWESRISSLSDQRTRQEVRYDSLVAGENWVNARRTTDLIEESNAEINRLNDNITTARLKADSLSTLIFQTNLDNVDVQREIGGFRFVAESFGQDTDTIVKWFVFLIIFVFDPMAVILILAFNNALEVDRGQKIRDKVKSGKLGIYGEESSNDEEIIKNVPMYDKEILDTSDIEIEGMSDKGRTIAGYKIHAAGGDVIVKPKYESKGKDGEVVYKPTEGE